MNVSIQITGKGNEELARTLAEATGPTARAALNQFMGDAVREATRDHLIEVAATHHTTADRLGGTRTGHMELAARAVEDSPVTADADAATLTINHVGLGRALHAVTITAGALLLPIPLNAMAYGHSPREFAQVILINPSGNRANPDKLAKEKKPIPTDIAAFLLVRSVTQKQDRTLLPSDSEWEAAALLGAEHWQAALRAKYGG